MKAVLILTAICLSLTIFIVPSLFCFWHFFNVETVERRIGRFSPIHCYVRSLRN